MSCLAFAGNPRRFRPYRLPFLLVLLLCTVGGRASQAQFFRDMSIDGDFADWERVTSYFDPAGDPHDTDHDQPFDVPNLVPHSDVDLLEYKFAHDDSNFYAYFRSAGQIGATQAQASGNGRAGRSYVIVTIDVDDDWRTGYWLHEGGYYPTSRGYDMNMELEFYDGVFNTGHYINHGARSAAEIPSLEADQRQGIVRVLPGSYRHYTQWVMFDDPSTGEHDLGDGTSITFVEDRGPIFQGNIVAAISADGHELEMMAPFRGFMSYPGEEPGTRGEPIITLGRTVNVSFSLEASGELQSPPGSNGQWASDTAEPIVGYFLSVPEPAGPGAWMLMALVWRRCRRRDHEAS